MHALVIRSKFTFGDRVRFASRLQGCSGFGSIYAITIDVSAQISYMIDIFESGIEPMASNIKAEIFEDEMELIQDSR